MLVNQLKGVSIGTRVGTGFVTMLTLLVTCGMVGLYGVNKVSDSLLFVTGDVWRTANGSMKTTINLQGDMLRAERILSHGLSPEEGASLIEQFYTDAQASLKQVNEANVIDPALLQGTEELINKYKAARLETLKSFSAVEQQKTNVKTATGNLLKIIPNAQMATEALQGDRMNDRAFGIEMENAYFHLDTIRLDTLLLSSTLQDFLSTNDPHSLLAKVTTERKQLDFLYGKTLELMNIEGLEKPKSSVVHHYSDLKQKIDRLLSDYLNFRKQHQEMNQIIETLLHNLNNVETQGNAVVQNEITRAEQLIKTSIWLILLTACSGILVAVIALAVLVFTVIHPIRHVAHNLKLIGEGEGDLNVALKETGAKELATLARGFNQFVTKIAKTVSGVSLTIEDLSRATSLLRETSDESTKAIKLQSAETEQVAAAINQMTSSASNVATNASEASKAASAADTSSTKGKAQVDSTIMTIHKQIEQLEIASAVVEQLAKDSNSIASVLDVINDIADQTNLLALNATIEAARAGEAGRGFAVVADEVRELAGRTQKATTQIQDVITKLHAAAAEAVTTMDSSQLVAKDSASQAKLSGKSLQEITVESKTINEMNLQIASAAEQQAIVAESINRSVETISDRAKVTQEASINFRSSTDQLSELTARLQRLIVEFKY